MRSRKVKAISCVMAVSMVDSLLIGCAAKADGNGSENSSSTPYEQGEVTTIVPKIYSFTVPATTTTTSNTSTTQMATTTQTEATTTTQTETPTTPSQTTATTIAETTSPPTTTWYIPELYTETTTAGYEDYNNWNDNSTTSSDWSNNNWEDNSNNNWTENDGNNGSSSWSDSSNNSSGYTNFYGYNSLPYDIQNTVDYLEGYYGMDIGVGIYSLDMSRGFEYKADRYYNSACTLKASYACWLYQQCDYVIDIENEYMYYGPEHHKPGGSGVIQNSGYGNYSINSLASNLTVYSDNDAWRVLQGKFSLNSFYNYNVSIGGESDWLMWGSATPRQRGYEWSAIYNYITSGAPNSQKMADSVYYTPYCYMTEWTGKYGWYYHKSGWTEESWNYAAAADAGIIDGQYILVIMTRDDKVDYGRVDVVKEVGAAVINYFAWTYF